MEERARERGKKRGRGKIKVEKRNQSASACFVCCASIVSPVPPLSRSGLSSFSLFLSKTRPKLFSLLSRSDPASPGLSLLSEPSFEQLGFNYRSFS